MACKRQLDNPINALLHRSIPSSCDQSPLVDNSRYIMSIHEPLRLLRIPHGFPSSCFGRGQAYPYISQTEENKRVGEETDEIVFTGDVSNTEDKNIDEQYRNIITPWIYTASNADVSVISGLVDVLRGWYGVLDVDAEIISRCIELIHISSLMLDDTENATPSRRERPAPHTVFGVTQTVHSAKFMTIKGIKELANLKNAECMRILLDQIVRQSFTSRPKDAPVAVSVDDHIEALDQKSGSIIRLINSLMAAASPLPSYETPPIDHVIDLFARLYALRDDYANLVPVTTSSSPKCSNSLDLKIQSFYMVLDEGKYSLLLVHALNVLPGDKVVLLEDILMQRRNTGRFKAEHKPLILEILRGCGSFEFVVGLVKDLQGTILQVLDELDNDDNSEGNGDRLSGGADISGFQVLVETLGL